MATNENPRQLSAIAGEQLRKFRESRGLRQEDIADMARKFGFTWGRSSVASLEAGNRDLSLEELLLLPTLFRRFGGWDEAIIPAGTQVKISESTWIPATQIPGHVLSLLAPTKMPERVERDSAHLEEEDFLLGSVENRDDENPENRRGVILGVTMYEYMFYKLWPEATNRYSLRPGTYEVDRRVAERITTPDGETADHGLVRAFAQGMYGRSVGDERDARTDERGTYDTKRALQSARGHVTRELIDELQTEITRRWPEVTEITTMTKEMTATDRGVDKWTMEFRALSDQHWTNRFEKSRKEKSHRPKFLRGSR
jgi:transcriptional regulator with XRE-family HTH domain